MTKGITRKSTNSSFLDLRLLSSNLLRPCKRMLKLRHSSVFISLLFFPILVMGENYQALLEDHKRQLFSKGLAERGYFRSSGLMKDSVVSSDETVYLTYLGDEDESLDLSSASWDSAIERGVLDVGRCSENGESGFHYPVRITIEKAGDQISGDLVTTNITSALTQFIQRETRGFTEEQPRGIKQTPYGRLSVSGFQRDTDVEARYEINVTQVPGMSEALRLIKNAITSDLRSSYNPNYVTKVRFQLFEGEVLIYQETFSKRFTLTDLAKSPSDLAFVAALYADLPPDVELVLSRFCPKPPILVATMAYDGIRMGAGSRSGFTEGQLFLLSPKREVYKREGLLSAIDSVHIARSVQVDPDSSLLNVVSGDAGIAVGSIFDVSVLEKSK